MGEIQCTLFQPEFNRSIHVEARPYRLSRDGGALLGRELLHRLGIMGHLSDELVDPRDGARIVHPFEELLRTLLLLQVQGWSDQTDVDALREDPMFRLAVSSRRQDRPLRPARGPGEPDGLCSQPTLSRCVAALAPIPQRERLLRGLHAWAERRHHLPLRGTVPEATVDLDSLDIPVYGHQPGSSYNGHFGLRCYHPLIVHWSLGDFLGARLRPGNAHTADGGHEVVLPHLRWAKRWVRELWLRIDAGFPAPDFLQAVEAEAVRYVARLRKNSRLEELAEPYLTRPPGRPPKEGRTWIHELEYRAHTWQRERRVVLVVLERPEEEVAEDGTVQQHLFLDHFFLLTNVPAEAMSGEALLERYRKRGRAEKDFGDWKQALQTHLSSSPRPKTHYRGRRVRDPGPPRDSFAVNEVWLLLNLYAANLLDLGRSLLRRATGQQVSREHFRQWLLKTATRTTLGGRRVTVVIDAPWASAWRAFWQAMVRAYPVRGSPEPLARPLPAA